MAFADGLLQICYRGKSVFSFSVSAQVCFSAQIRFPVHKIIPGTQWAKNGRKTMGLHSHWGLLKYYFQKGFSYKNLLLSRHRNVYAKSSATFAWHGIKTTRQKLIPEYHPRRDQELLQAWRQGSDRASASNITFQAILYSSSIQNAGLIQGFAWQSWHPDMPVHNPYQH